MPACRPPPLRPALVSKGLRNSQDRIRHHIRAVSCTAQRTARRHASSAAVARKPTGSDTITSQNTVRTTLHKVSTFLPRVLPAKGDPEDADSLDYWKDVLDGAYNRLNATTDSTARIAVYGYGEHSEARELVTALLEDPFAPETRKQVIRDRWNGARQQDGGVTSTYGYAPSDDPACLRVPSAWLQQFPLPVEIHELTQSVSSIKHLATADIPVIVLNPLESTLAFARRNHSLPWHHANAILCIVSSSEISPELRQAIVADFPPTLSIVFVDPKRALAAVRILSSEPGSSVAVQRYQDNFTASRISVFTSLVAEKLAATSGHPALLHSITVGEQIKAALTRCSVTLYTASDKADEVETKVLDLRNDVEKFEASIGPKVLGTNSVDYVRGSVSRARRDVKVVMDRMTWWRCVWRVDDVGETVKAAVDKAWCRDLEDELIFHSGSLAAMQTKYVKSTMDMLDAYKPPSPFHSPILRNELSQIQASPSFKMTPSALTSSIHTRRAQLMHPTNALHATAQRITVGMGGSVLGGLGTIWAGWAEHLGMFGGMFGPGLEMETALGTGLFIGTFGVWWMVQRWEKAKKRWWKAWDRVGEGLERDLQTDLEKAVDEKVTIVPTHACNRLLHLARAREDEIVDLQDELVSLQEEADGTPAEST